MAGKGFWFSRCIRDGKHPLISARQNESVDVATPCVVYPALQVISLARAEMAGGLGSVTTVGVSATFFNWKLSDDQSATPHPRTPNLQRFFLLALDLDYK